MIKLSKRLAAAAELVRPCESFADIGCDHGYLPAYLVQNNIVKKAYACDINEGPLSKCREVAEQEGVAGKITCILAPGLLGLNEREASEIAIGSFCLDFCAKNAKFQREACYLGLSKALQCW